MGFDTLIRITDKLLGTTVAEGTTKPAAKVPLADNPGAVLAFSIVGTLCFVGIVLPYLTCDLWIDECVTLETHIIKRRFASCFLSYAVPNNHILYTALLWIWANFFKLISEAALRLPCLVMTLATAYTLYNSCKRFFRSPAAGMFAAMLLLFSPVYIGFCWQMRGYAMSILFASFVVSGILLILRDERRTGTLLFAIGAIPLPAVVPTNLFFSYCMVLFLLIFYAREKRLTLNVLFLALLAAISTVGMITYVPIYDKLERALMETRGWDSGLEAAGHWLMAVAAHAALFPLVCIALRSSKGVEPAPTPDDDRNKGKGKEKQTDDERLRGHLPILAACSIIPCTLVLLIRAPFPRVFLPFLVPLTVASMAFYETRLVRVNRNFYVLMCLILANFLVWTRVSGMLEHSDRQRGILRQNLLQQFYASNTDISHAASLMHDEIKPGTNVRIFVEFEFYLTMTKYWPVPDQIECLGWAKVPLKLKREHYALLPKLAVGYNRERLRRRLMKELSSDIRLTPLLEDSGIGIFRVDMPPPPRTKRAPGSAMGPPTAEPIAF